jgi:hypothetical protein
LRSLVVAMGEDQPYVVEMGRVLPEVRGLAGQQPTSLALGGGPA